MIDKLKIATYNVRGLADRFKRRKLFRSLHNREYDIVFLQETHITKNKEKVWKNEWGSKIVFNHGESNARGTAILFVHHLDPKITNTWKSEDSRILFLQLEINSVSFTLCNIYAPNSDSPPFFQSILQKLECCDTDFRIIGGDLNIYLDPVVNYKGKAQPKVSESASIIYSFMAKMEWMDVWRILHPEKFEFTWKRTKPLTMS